ncbi:MAG TPA: non-lysosomal glucosylceramidase [Terriglobales bacterium]|nr:non-lysosomal glucosylceramidase [Terriglobales bacterium]
MSRHILRLFAIFALLCTAWAGDQIPNAAWRIPLGTIPDTVGGRKPELVTNIDDGPFQGAPVGGFGAGTFSRTTRGNFERWHLKAGVHKYQNVPANQFAVFAQAEGQPAVAQVLSTSKPEHGELSSWNWSYPAGKGEYAAVYPKAWYVYNSQQLPVKLTLEQFSPVLPNNYRESSYPVAVFNWYVENPTGKPVTVSVLFSWTNMVGWFRDFSRDFRAGLSTLNKNAYRSEKLANGSMQGIVFDRLRFSPVQDEWDGQFAIATLAGADAQVSYVATYDPSGPGADTWNTFSKDGTLPNTALDFESSGETIAGAIAVKITVPAGGKKVIPMALSWDLPIYQFGSGRKWVRHYTKFFNESGTNAWNIAKVALQQGEKWSAEIDAWQKPILGDESKPAWYRSELFNELYILADGGTAWGHELSGNSNPKHKSAQLADTFSFLECFDYLYYGTLDVRFYGSFPLIKFWPDLEKQEMRQFADTIGESLNQNTMWSWKSTKEGKLVLMPRKAAGVAPHDLGSPLEDAFTNVNQYNYQNVTDWRDLNSKFVLLIWRDYVLSGKKDIDFLRYAYPAVKLAMQHLLKFDTDGDGLIENGGFPDQTYDNWVARGESSYSGSLYVAALRATAEMARIVGDNAIANSNDALFKKVQAAFIKKLWNNSYFDYDTASPYKKDIMAEQLAGQWYASLTGLGDLVPPEMRKSALQRVYDYNVMKFQNGKMGAVNGIGADGEGLKENEQVEEVWVGTTFSVASHMISEGLKEQGFATAKGVNNVVWVDRGYWFRTPEAYNAQGFYRASMYMRPGAIWAMEYSLEGAAQKSAK